MKRSPDKCEELHKRFEEWRKELDDQLTNVQTHYSIWLKMSEATHDDLDAINRVPGFWQFTMRAHLNEAFMGLSRLADNDSKSGSIRQYLGFVSRNSDCFQSTHQPFDNQRLKNIRAKLKPARQLLDNLAVVRDKIYAHIDAGTIGRKKELHEDYPIVRRELEEAIVALDSVLNEVSVAYDGVSYVHGVIGVAEGVDEIVNGLNRQTQFWQDQQRKYLGEAAANSD